MLRVTMAKVQFLTLGELLLDAMLEKEGLIFDNVSEKLVEKARIKSGEAGPGALVLCGTL
jgi:hypothetical protein